MKARTTLIKNYRNKETLRLVELQEVPDFIRKIRGTQDQRDTRSRGQILFYLEIKTESVPLIDATQWHTRWLTPVWEDRPR